MTTPIGVRRSTRAVLLAVVGTVCAAAAAVIVLHALATASFQRAEALRIEEATRLAISQHELDAAATEAEFEVAVADAALTAAPVGYVSAEAAAALTDSRSALDEAVAAVRESIVKPTDPLAAPLDPFALWVAADQRLEQAKAAHAAADEQAAAIEALTAAEASTDEAGAALVASASAIASTILPANPSVANVVHLDFLDLLDALRSQAELDTQAVSLLADYVTSVAAVRASHAAEEAEKSGSLYGLRVQVEAYARSIAGGALLDFNWQPTVIGYSMAGTATIERRPPYFYSTITLTNSIAENWGDIVPLSLVTHEVGHAITSKCLETFDAYFGTDYELWATAWAMSWGYPAGASGADSYGTPSPDQVAAAGTCR